jgi:hypothetical protein
VLEPPVAPRIGAPARLLTFAIHDREPLAGDQSFPTRAQQ